MPADRPERRTPAPPASRLREGLTAKQQAALDVLEQFRWTLQFVRRPLFRDPMPVVVHPDGRVAILEPDGRIVEDPGITLRS